MFYNSFLWTCLRPTIFIFNIFSWCFSIWSMIISSFLFDLFRVSLRSEYLSFWIQSMKKIFELFWRKSSINVLPKNWIGLKSKLLSIRNQLKWVLKKEGSVYSIFTIDFYKKTKKWTLKKEKIKKEQFKNMMLVIEHLKS